MTNLAAPPTAPHGAADELGIDLMHTAIGGASAGANLATYAVLRLLALQNSPDAVGGAGSGTAVGAATEKIALPAVPPAGVFLAYPTTDHQSNLRITEGISS